MKKKREEKKEKKKKEKYKVEIMKSIWDAALSCKVHQELSK
jgi:hypothetical protein